MNKIKGFSVMAVVLLIVHLFTANAGLIADSVQESNADGPTIEVQQIDQGEDTIKWLVTANAEAKENEGLDINVYVGNGHKQLSIENFNDVVVAEKEDGYSIETPLGNEKYVFEISTEIENTEQTTFELSAELNNGLSTLLAYDQFSLDRQSVQKPIDSDDLSDTEADDPEEDWQSDITGEENKTEDAPENDQSASDKAENKTPENDSTENTPTETENPENILENPNPNPEEKTTDDSDNEEIAEETEEELSDMENEQAANKAEEKAPIIQEKDQFKTTNRPNAIAGVQSGENWPAPGSLKLTKEAATTDTYAEWEIELNIEGKNLKTSSDIVLVFDRSNSMYESRLAKAKNAAETFVDQLLTEDATTRIALVPFGTYADPYTDFTTYENKQDIINAISNIKVTGGNDGGTNIQAGLHQAQMMLQGSNAEQKTIVLLSDGQPTYSYKASNVAAYSWPENKYNFILSNFNYNNQIGQGNSYHLSWLHEYRVGGLWSGYTVKTNGIATVSEAQHIMNAGTNIYSIGLEVGNDRDATYVLKNSQNKGYYAGGDDDLSPIFNEIAASVGSPARQSVVTDPLGDKFNLVKDGSYSGENFSASHGGVSWDDASETFTWDIGTITEGEVYTLKYKVTIDWSKHPIGHVFYPTNKETPLNYKDPDNVDQVKQFPIPEVKIASGKINKIGYRVNANGDPIDGTGTPVASPAEAEQLYNEVHGDDLLFGETYPVPANVLENYTLFVGDDPTHISLSVEDPFQTVLFGYVYVEDLVGGNVTAKYIDEFGTELANEDIFTGNIGEQYVTVQKEITNYVFLEMHADSAATSGVFTESEQTVIYVYAKKLGSLTVIKVDENEQFLRGAKFELRDLAGNVLATGVSDEAGEIKFTELEVGEYALIETKAPAGFNLLTSEISVVIDNDTLHVTETIENTAQDWVIPDTGGIGTPLFYGVGILLMGLAGWLFIRKRRA